jgi:hypothetical protein
MVLPARKAPGEVVATVRGKGLRKKWSCAVDERAGRREAITTSTRKLCVSASRRSQPQVMSFIFNCRRATCLSGGYC